MRIKPGTARLIRPAHNQATGAPFTLNKLRKYGKTNYVLGKLTNFNLLGIFNKFLNFVNCLIKDILNCLWSMKNEAVW